MYEQFFLKEASNATINFSVMIDGLEKNLEDHDRITWEGPDSSKEYKDLDLNWPKNKTSLEVYFHGKLLYTYKSNVFKVRRKVGSHYTLYSFFTKDGFHSKITVS